MNMKKKFISVFLMLTVFCAVFGGCGVGSVRVLVPDGGTLLPMAKMFYDGETEDGVKINCEIVSGVAVEARLFAGTCEAAIAPINLCAGVYNADKSFVLAGVAVWGNSYIVSTGDNTLESIDGLKGKILCAWGEKAVPGVTLKAILKKNGLDYKTIFSDGEAVSEDTVYLKFFMDAPSIRQEMAKGGVDYAMLPEPAATDAELKNQAVVRLDLQELYDPNNSYPQAGLMIKRSWADKNPAVAKKLISSVAASAEYCLSEPAETARLAKDELQSAALPPTASISAYITGRGQNVMRFDPLTDESSRRAVLDYLDVVTGGNGVPDSGFFMV
jgi:ABC-type nitrate/sulfonate/bicarbonate transport system substrate-binding protein